MPGEGIMGIYIYINHLVATADALPQTPLWPICPFSRTASQLLGSNATSDIGSTAVVSGLRLRNDLYCVGWGVKLYSCRQRPEL